MGDKKRKTKGKPDRMDVHVGKRLKIRRSLLGLSQEKLAEAIGLTFQQVQKYERGVNRISAGRLYQFSKILNVPITYFYEQVQNDNGTEGIAYGMSDNPQEDFKIEDPLQDKNILKLINAYQANESEELREEVLHFAKKMANLSKKTT